MITAAPLHEVFGLACGLWTEDYRRAWAHFERLKSEEAA